MLYWYEFYLIGIVSYIFILSVQTIIFKHKKTILLTGKFVHFFQLSIIIFLHIIWGLFFGNPQQEVHFVIGYILLYATQYYFLDLFFLPTIKKVEAFWSKQ